ncbi:hypothetical protein AN216_19425 [Streptomyces oceani]|uniref:Uncharacterized protein n=1 Tax=Streptomyces oceani TaxID=1075402 RepID=A0A1E7JYA7_9ACTN|nr:hypothetical protein AN216_19425 [Streptomyces oceani]
MDVLQVPVAARARTIKNGADQQPHHVRDDQADETDRAGQRDRRADHEGGGEDEQDAGALDVQADVMCLTFAEGEDVQDLAGPSTVTTPVT